MAQCSRVRVVVVSGGEDAAVLLAGEIDSFGGAGGKGITLGVKADVLQAVGADGLEGAEADVEGDGFNLDTFMSEGLEDFGGEVEARGWGGGGAKGVCVDGLVAGAVFGGVRERLITVDVGRERHVADALKDFEEILAGGETEGAFAVVAGGKDFSLEDRDGAFVEDQMFAGLDFCGRGGPGWSRCLG